MGANSFDTVAGRGSAEGWPGSHPFPINWAVPDRARIHTSRSATRFRLSVHAARPKGSAGHIVLCHGELMGRGHDAKWRRRNFKAL